MDCFLSLPGSMLMDMDLRGYLLVGLEHRSGWSTHASVCTLFGVDGDGDGTVKKETNPNVSIGTE